MEGLLIGYARVSTSAQELNLQLDALKHAGCKKQHVFTDHISGSKAERRPGLAECLKELKNGDTLIIWRLDRLGRSLRNLIDIVEQLPPLLLALTSLSTQSDHRLRTVCAINT